MNSGIHTPHEIHPVVSQVHVDDMGIASILSNKNITINVDHVIDSDEAMLLAIGYRQELRREFSLWSIFAVSFSVLGLLPSIAACFDYQQLVVGMSPLPWLIAMIFITSVAYSMAEIASAFPCSAGTPYAVSQLAPKKYASFLTWFTCWTNWSCQITAAPSVSYSCACMMLALHSFTDPSFVASNAQIFGLTTGIQVLCAFMACFPTKWVARFSSAGTTCNIVFLVVVFVMILGGNKRDQIKEGISKFNSNSTAWGLDNQAEWPTGLSFLISFMGVIWAMSGYDSPFHLAEECSNAAVAAPRAIVLTSTVGGLIGFMFMIAIAYTLVDLNQISTDPEGLGQPFVTYLTQIMDKNLVIGATALTIISSFFMAQNCLLASSRVTYAYARDGLFPLSGIWKKVSPKTQTPINAVIMNFIVEELLLLLIFGGDVSIGSIFSIGALAGFISFTMPTLLKITYARKTFQPGPWNLGKWSEPIGWVSVAFVGLMVPILCFPTVKGADLTPTEMNWTCLVYFGLILLTTIWFVVDARRWYVGPRTNISEEDIVYGEKTEDEGDEIPDVIDGQKVSISSTEKRYQ